MFSSPLWNANNNTYVVSIANNREFDYKEKRNKLSDTNFFREPNVESSEFQGTLLNFAEEVSKQGSQWFASPIKSSVFIKKIKNTFSKIEENINYGNNVEFTWTPSSLEITSRYFNLNWNLQYENIKEVLIPHNFINLSDEAEEIEVQDITVQEQNDIIENMEIPFDNSEKELVEVNSRAAFKKELHRFKLKAAIATMKAEKLAEKYFRRYGIENDDDFGSDILFESDEENSDEE